MTPDHLVLALLSLGICASLYLFLQIKIEARRRELNLHQELEQIRFQLNEHRTNWIDVTRRLNEPAIVQLPLNAKVAIKPSRTNMWSGDSKSKALEMVKSGEEPAKVSAALSLPRSHVEFLIKLERAAALKS